MKFKQINLKTIRQIFVSVLLSSSINVSASVSPVFSINPFGGAILFGFDGIELSNSTTKYSVRFKEGTIGSVFPDGLDFTNFITAYDASSILSQVFTQFPYFDDNPGTTLGCAGFVLSCGIITPYSNINSIVFGNYLPPHFNTTDTFSLSAINDTFNKPSLVFADWSASTTTVPLPPALLLFGCGLLGLLGVTRRNILA